jgi:hypothetical protein
MAIIATINAVLVAGSKRKRRQKYLFFIAFMGVMLLGHTYQAYLAVAGLRNTVAPLWAKFLFVLYGVVNASVVLTQCDVIWRATHLVRAVSYEHRRSIPHPSDRQVNIMCAVTFGGQAAFLIPWFLYYVSR